MRKLSVAIFSIMAISSTAFATESKRHLGGTIIAVSSVSSPRIAKVKQVPAARFQQRDLFDYGVDEKGLSKSQREYREFLAQGSFSRSRSIGGNSYRNVGGGSGIGGRVYGRAIYGKPFNKPRSSSGGFATISNRGGVSGGGLSRGGFASLGRR